MYSARLVCGLAMYTCWVWQVPLQVMHFSTVEFIPCGSYLQPQLTICVSVQSRVDVQPVPKAYVTWLLTNLKACMGVQEEVKLCRGCDLGVHHRSWQAVLGLEIGVGIAGRQQPRVVLLQNKAGRG